jgi:hypothetical protein
MPSFYLLIMMLLYSSTASLYSIYMGPALPLDGKLSHLSQSSDFPSFFRPSWTWALTLFHLYSSSVSTREHSYNEQESSKLLHILAVTLDSTFFFYHS